MNNKRMSRGIVINSKLLLTVKQMTRSRIVNKHNISNDEYTQLMLNCLIFNERTRLVSLFKDNLISDDSSEFLRR
jgi:hypothetical protein